MSTLVVDKFDPNKVQTHVLVVGVNDYPYLKDGRLTGQGITTHMNLGQLAAPVPSATAIADFFARTYVNPKAPIGSVAALLSGGKYVASSATTAQEVAEPTFAEIYTAFQAWTERLEAQITNVGVFYFCGHGVEPSSMLLLPQDFGQDRRDPWNNAINLTATYQNLAQIKTGAQLCLIDACRKSTADADDAALKGARSGNALGRPLIGIMADRVFVPRAAPLIVASPVGQKAYAPGSGQSLSYFAQAVLDCLSRVGAERRVGENWIVTTDSLGRCLKERLSRVKLTNGGTATCATMGESNYCVDLHHIKGRAAVLSRITTDPLAALAKATFEFTDSMSPTVTRAPSPDPWETELLAGTNWQLKIDLPPGTAWGSKTLGDLVVYPPVFEETVIWP